MTVDPFLLCVPGLQERGLKPSRNKDNKLLFELLFEALAWELLQEHLQNATGNYAGARWVKRRQLYENFIPNKVQTDIPGTANEMDGFPCPCNMDTSQKTPPTVQRRHRTSVFNPSFLEAALAELQPPPVRLLFPAKDTADLMCW